MMKMSGYSPNVIIYTVILHAYNATEDSEMTCAPYLEIEINNIQPDSITCSALIRAFNKGGQLSKVLVVAEFIREKYITFCDAIFFEMVSACSIGGSSSTYITVGERLVSTLLTEIDSLEQAKGILVLVAINRPRSIDAALMRPGSFDLILYVPHPDLEARYEILHVHTWNMKVENDIDLRGIAEETELFTGAELEGLYWEAGIVALRKDLSTTIVCNRHFQTIKDSLKLALTKEEIDSYSSFKKSQSLKSYGQLEYSTSLGSKNSLIPVFSVTTCVVSIALLAVAKYFCIHANQTTSDLVVT